MSVLKWEARMLSWTKKGHVRGTAEVKPLEGELRLPSQILGYKGQKA